MRPRERRETGEQDLFRSRLDQIIDMKHPLVTLGRTMDWRFLEGRFGEVYTDDPGHPPLPTRLMAGLAILKHTYDLSDEVLCERWVENPYYQFFCGEEFFQHCLVFDRSSLTRWRQRMGEEKLQALLQESLSVATKTEAIKPADLNRIIVDTTVQPKNVMFPTDARLLNRAREILVRRAKRHGLALRQSYARVGKFALIKHQRYAHAKQFKRANRALRMLKTYLGRVIRHNAPPDYNFRVVTSRQKRRMTPNIKRERRRRSAVEPVIGHLKSEHRMGRNYLWHREGDATNAVLAAVGYNFRRLIRWLSLLLSQILAQLTLR